MSQVLNEPSPSMSPLAADIMMWIGDNEAASFKVLFDRYMGRGHTEQAVQAALLELVNAGVVEKVSFQ